MIYLRKQIHSYQSQRLSMHGNSLVADPLFHSVLAGRHNEAHVNK